METERAAGIVLRCQPVTESSLLVTWLTREFGKLKTLAKGARRPKSPMRGRMDLFYQDEIVFLRSRRSDLHLLHDCFLEEPHRALRENLPALAAASYVCELVDAVMPVEDPSPVIYDLLAGMLALLERRVAVAPVIWFELQVWNAAGWRPAFETVTGTGKLLRALTTAQAAGAERVRLTAAQGAAALATVARFRDEQLGRGLRSQKILWQQLSR